MPHEPPTADDRVETGDHPLSRAKGQVHARSNVCADPNAWGLVPGDILKRYGLHYGNTTKEQAQEMTYYEPCSLCKRTYFTVQEKGCDHPICRRSGVLSAVDAAQRKRVTRTEKV